MATICFRPPPLPPNKKSSHLTNGNRHRSAPKQNHGLLSSTYLSFRDPADDEILNAAEDIELTSIKCKNSAAAGKRCKKLTHTNSLSRGSAKDQPRVIMTRSHSDGNIDKKGITPAVSINRYMKVLSGSWRNLLNCKLMLVF